MLPRNGRQVVKMNGLAVIGSLSSCRVFCDNLRNYALGLQGWTFQSYIDALYDSTTELSKTLELLRFSFESSDLDEKRRTQHVHTFLASYETASQKLHDTELLMRRYETPDETPQNLVIQSNLSLKKMVGKALAEVASIQELLEPALHDLQLTEADTNTATTSGFEKGPTNRHRLPAQQGSSYTSSPVVGPVKTIPYAEGRAVGKALSDAEPGALDKEYSRRVSHSAGGVGERLARKPAAATKKPLLRRIPFCYLLAALGLIFILSSAAVGIYYTFAKKAMGDGFTTAGYMLAVGTLVVTPPAAYHYQHCQCWKPVLESARQEGMV